MNRKMEGKRHIQRFQVARELEQEQKAHLITVISDVGDEVRHVMRYLTGWTSRQRNHTIAPRVPGIKRHVLQIELEENTKKTGC